METDPCHVAIYLRVSTEEQDVARQVAACERLAEEHFAGLPTSRYLEEGRSAFKNSILDRPESSRMVEDILAGRLAGIVADAQDRLSRGKQSELWGFIDLCQQHGVKIVTVADGVLSDDNEIGEVMLALRQTMSRQESVKRAHRVSSALDTYARQGYWTNGVPPFGFTIAGQKRQRFLVPTPQIALAKRAFDMYASGENSINQITEWLNASGATTHRGGRWYRQNVKDDILANPAYVGRQRHRGEVLEAKHDAVICSEVWDAVEERLRFNPSPPAHVQPFGGSLIKCVCNGRLVFQRDRRGARYLGPWSYYVCRDCGRSHVGEYVEASIMFALIGTAWTLERELLQPSFEPGSTAEEVAALQASIRAAEAGVSALADAVESGSQVAVARLVEKERELDGLRSLLAKHHATADEIRANWRAVANAIKGFNVSGWDERPEAHDVIRAEAALLSGLFIEQWATASQLAKKKLVLCLVDRIVVEDERVLLTFKGAGFPHPIPIPLTTGNRHQAISRDLRELGFGSGGTTPEALSSSPS